MSSGKQIVRTGVSLSSRSATLRRGLVERDLPSTCILVLGKVSVLRHLQVMTVLRIRRFLALKNERDVLPRLVVFDMKQVGYGVSTKVIIISSMV